MVDHLSSRFKWTKITKKLRTSLENSQRATELYWEAFMVFQLSSSGSCRRIFRALVVLTGHRKFWKLGSFRLESFEYVNPNKIRFVEDSEQYWLVFTRIQWTRVYLCPSVVRGYQLVSSNSTTLTCNEKLRDDIAVELPTFSTAGQGESKVDARKRPRIRAKPGKQLAEN